MSYGVNGVARETLRVSAWPRGRRRRVVGRGAGLERLWRRKRFLQSACTELHREGDCDGHEDRRRSLDQRNSHRAVTRGWRKACVVLQDCV
jgi:hypothetical protein